MGFNYQQPGKVKQADLAIFIGAFVGDRRARDLGDLVAAMTGDVASLDFCYLTTTGRISGNPHRIEIWFVLADRTVFLMAGDRDRSDWVRNLMITPEVELELGGRKRASRGPRGRRSIGGGRARSAPHAREVRGARRGDLSTWGRTALVVAIDWPVGVSYTSLI